MDDNNYDAEKEKIEKVMRCCVCKHKLDGIIRTLPCLHSAHINCLKTDVAQQLGTNYDKIDPICPSCLHPFPVPKTLSRLDDLPVDYFTASIVAATTVNTNIDPNDIGCEICVDDGSTKEQAVVRCQTCQQFFCEACQRGHKRAKANATHQFITLDEVFQGGSSIPKARILHCHKHSHQEINSFCKTDETGVCPQCAIEFHKGHDVNLLSSITTGFKNNLSTTLNKVKGHQGSLATAIDVIEKTVTEVDKEAEKTKKEINEACDALKKAVEERRAELTKEVEKMQREKRDELLKQRNQLNVLKTGIYDSSLFTEVLLKEGTETEIAASQKRVMIRLDELDKERARSTLEPTIEASIGFEGGAKDGRGLKEVIEIVKGMGSVVSRDISTEKSFIELSGLTQPVSCSFNQPFTFKVIVVDKKGERVSTKDKKGNGNGKSIPFSVNISGGNQQRNIDITENENGEFLVSINVSVVGKQEISVVHKGNHFKGSLIRIDVVDKPKGPFLRDYNTVPAQPVAGFGSNGSGDGQFGYIDQVASNIRGEIIVADAGNHRIQVFDKTGRFLFKFGSQGNGNGQFNYPYGVTVDQRNNQIVVADYFNHRIQIFDEKGSFIRSFGSKGSGDGKFDGPWGIAVDQQGNYYVAENAGDRVQIFNSNCQFIRKFGSQGNGNGQFRFLRGVGILSNGSIVVSDYGNKRVQIFDSQGNFLRVIGSGQLGNVEQVFVDSNDNILVGQKGKNTVEVFKADGTLVKTIGEGQLNHPCGVCMDPEGRIIVSEFGNNRISIF